MSNYTKYKIRRASDESIEQNLHLFYNTLYHAAGFKVHRVHDAKRQRLGVDVELTSSSGLTVLVDEKSAIKYFNKNLTTFSFEISSKNNRGHGWFWSSIVDVNHETDYFVLGYIRAPEKNNNLKCINTLEILFVRPRAVVSYIRSCGCTLEDKQAFMEHFNAYSKKGQYSDFDDESYPGIKIVSSKHLKYEQPVNILVPKEKLCSLAEIHMVLTTNGDINNLRTVSIFDKKKDVEIDLKTLKKGTM